jgi:hypothetical protein
VVAVLMTAVLFLARPHLAVLALEGVAVVLGLGLAGLVVYGTGLALRKYQPPARVIFGGGAFVSFEFA